MSVLRIHPYRKKKQDGTIMRDRYPLDLDSLQEGNRVGLLRHPDGSLHYYLDGQDQGAVRVMQLCVLHPILGLQFYLYFTGLLERSS